MRNLRAQYRHHTLKFLSREEMEARGWDLGGPEVLSCPVCGDIYTHHCSVETVDREDNYRAWRGRGSLTSVRFYCEQSHVFTLNWGFHKGNTCCFWEHVADQRYCEHCGEYFESRPGVKADTCPSCVGKRKLSKAEYAQYMKSSAWQRKRQEVMERCQNICERCHERETYAVRHLTYDHAGNEPLIDLQAVCKECNAFLAKVSDYDPSIAHCLECQADLSNAPRSGEGLGKGRSIERPYYCDDCQFQHDFISSWLIRIANFPKEKDYVKGGFKCLISAISS
jgi:hypothetical protein